MRGRTAAQLLFCRALLRTFRADGRALTVCTRADYLHCTQQIDGTAVPFPRLNGCATNATADVLRYTSGSVPVNMGVPHLPHGPLLEPPPAYQHWVMLRAVLEFAPEQTWVELRRFAQNRCEQNTRRLERR